MLDRLPRSIGARHLHTIVVVLIAGSLVSFALGQQMAHGSRSDAYAVDERVSAWVMPAVAHASTHPSTVMTAETQDHESNHHDKHHGGDQGGGNGGNGGDGGGGG
jgi:uncharacterized membrane protein YgcG